MNREASDRPLEHLEDWEDSLLHRYPDPKGKEQKPFRDYANAQDRVREFYRQNHRYQTYEFVRAKEERYLPLERKKMGVWEAILYLNTLVDDSDPDTDLSQIEHLMQAAEAIRRDGHPRWFVLTGLIHDLGKILCFEGEPQWAVVGDTFPVGCAFSPKIVFPEFFADNPDIDHPVYGTRLGVYEEGCGLQKVHLSWGHDEYLFHVVRDYLPEQALYMIRYHSFYPAHREGEYDYLMDDQDREMFEWVRKFNPYDLYSKGESPPDVEGLAPYYRELIDEFFPPSIRW